MRYAKQLLQFVCLLLCCVGSKTAKAQKRVVARVDIEQAIADNKLAVAETLVKNETAKFFAAKLPDSLNHFIFYTGKVEQLKTNAAEGVKKVEALVQQIKSITASPNTLRQTYIEAGEYFGFAGKNNLAYKANQRAFAYALSLPNNTGQLGNIESNLGTYAQRFGDIALSTQHQRQALKYRLANPNSAAEDLYISYNNMGTIMWYASKLDSAIYFFNKALETVKKTEQTPLNQYYRPALVLNNVSGIYSLQGNTTEAIKALKKCIQNLKTFIASKEPHLKKNAAINLKFEATDNLAGIYKDLGDYRQAHSLLLYSYQQKQQQLGKDDPAVFISQILLGQLYYAMKDNNKALLFLNDGLHAISKADGDYTFWQADACNTLALLNDERKNKKEAAVFFEKADSLYDASLQGEYDNIYLEFVANAALFYAENGNTKAAFAKAKKAYDYIIKSQGAQTLPASYQLLNLSEVSYLSGNYADALTYSNQSLSAVNTAIRTSGNLLDSVKMELKKPKAILQKTKAGYALLQKKDKNALSAMLTELNEALTILERRKTILTSPEDIGLLMADQRELVKFIEKLNVELFKLTNDRSYLNKFIGLHESAMYNRIRSRLDQADSLQFAKVPANVIAKEKSLKAAIAISLEGAGSHDQKMQAYFAATEAWTKYQQAVKTQYPRYYQMRYASLFKSLEQVRKAIPEQTTIVRYFFTENDLIAWVADAQHENIVLLSAGDVDKKIMNLNEQLYDAGKTGELLLGLYQQLWSPIEKDVRNKRVIIIPDGILYNLSFETLTPRKISSFKELATNSLLATHSIAYHYSLFLVNQKKEASYNNSFIAFAPGFTDKIKQQYRSSADSNALPDNNYLSLLPQPFTIDLASKTHQLLGGDAFFNEQSTEKSFRQNAGNHKIIHIGTHAESDNLHPEFSRLIFAKESSKDDDNSLYLPEIYNCNLNADLAVLTACESGKPGYEDGEGMISLAHAFNYAGSQSILTGLWKIDEQASAVIMEAFYKNIVTGMTKDEALRQAKLSYLGQADGRALSPQYWAGLVIMGDTSPIALKEETTFRWKWLAVAVLALTTITTGLVYYKRRKNA